MKKLIYMTLFLIMSIVLLGCTEEEVKKERVEFEPNNFINSKESSYLEERQDNQEEVFADVIKQTDYSIDNILLSEFEKDLYYSDILNMDIDEVLLTQLTYMELHREYMEKLFISGASQERLILQNRIFKKHLDIYKGNRFNDKNEVKSIIEKNFFNYNIEEFDAIVKGEDIKDFIVDYRNWEEEIGYNEWMKKKDNVNYAGDLLVRKQVKIEDLSEEKNIKGIYDKIKEVEGNIDTNFYIETNNKDLDMLLEKLDGFKKDIENVQLKDDYKWIKERALRIIDRNINYLSLIKEDDMFKALDERFFVGVTEMEDIVSFYLMDKHFKEDK